MPSRLPRTRRASRARPEVHPWLEVAGGVRVTGDGAAWLPEHSALVVADIHLGYELAARRRGGYLPTAATAREIAARLSGLARDLGARRVVIAGDLRHSTRDVDARERTEIASFAVAMREHVVLDVISGNHDGGEALAGEPDQALLVLGDVTITHAPPDVLPEQGIVVCGHLHPRITLRDGTGAAARYHCALSADRLIILPAFSDWAGGVEASRLVRRLPPAVWRVLPMVSGEVADVGMIHDTRDSAR